MPHVPVPLLPFPADDTNVPLTFSDRSLLEVMDGWPSTGVRGAVIVVDEGTNDSDVSGDRAERHGNQAEVLRAAARLGMPVYVVCFGAPAEYAEANVFDSGLSDVLDAVVPSGTFAYQKGALETNGFDNGRLVADVRRDAVTDVVIMGQSVNACCAATARGAAAARLRVHSAGPVIRGGHVATEAPQFFGGPASSIAGWPDGTTFYNRL